MYKNLKNIVVVLLIFTTFFLTNAEFLSDASGSTFVPDIKIISTLSPESVINPISGPERTDKTVLETLLFVKLMEDRDLLETIVKHGVSRELIDTEENDRFTHINGRNVILYLSKFFRAHKGIIIPCNVDGKLYFAVTMNGKDVVGEVYTEAEFKEEYKEFGDPDKVLDAIKADGAVRVIDITDNSVRVVLDFLDAIRADNLKSFSTEKVTAGMIFVSTLGLAGDEGGRPEGGIVIPPEYVDDAGKKAGFILKGILENIGVEKNTIEFREFMTMFDRFRDLSARGRENKFDISKTTAAFRCLLWEIEHLWNSTEGYIRFSNDAYKKAIDLHNISIESCGETIDDIKDIFRKVAESELERYGKSDDAVLRKGMPGIDPEMIIVDDFSNGFLPTARVEADGLIRVNVNFIRLMHKLKSEGLDGELGALSGPESDAESGDPVYAADTRLPDAEFPGPEYNLYKSILFSVAINAVRGHFKLDESGMLEFNADEKTALGERGSNQDGYVNIISMMFYWIVFVEQSQFPRDRAIKIIRNYPELFRNITERQRKILPSVLSSLYRTLVDRGVILRVQESQIDESYWDVTLAHVDVHRGSKARLALTGGVLYDRSNRSYSGRELLFSIYEQIFEAGADGYTREGIMNSVPKAFPFSINCCLAFLESTDLVRFDAEEGKYRPALISPGARDEIRKILRGTYDTETDDITKKLASEVYKVTSLKWIYDALEGLEVFSSESDNRIMLAIETDWVPEGQKDQIRRFLQEIQKLNKRIGGIEIVRGSSGDIFDRIAAVKSREGIKDDNIIILAGENTFNMNRENDIVRDKKAFLAGINAEHLKDDSYIRIFEMLSIAVNMASGIPVDMKGHSYINVTPDDENPRRVLFTPFPEAEPFNASELRDIYSIQLKALTAA